MRHDDIRELASAAALFQKQLNRVKRDNNSAEFGWYPYDPFRVFPVMVSMLKEDRRDLLELAGPAPVLDIGCADGDLSFFFESLGCDVRAIDNSDPNFNGTRGFRTLHRAINSRVEFEAMDLDRGLHLPGRTFGLVLCLGVLYHLKNPFGLLETLAHHARHCVLSTRVAQRTPSGVSIENEPLTYLLNPLEANGDASNYWIFSPSGLRRLLERTGWDVCDYATTGFQNGSNPSSDDRDQRAFCMIRSQLPDPWSNVDLDGGWHDLENGSWRWTERVFGVLLPRAELAGPTRLRFRFTLAQEILASTGPLTLSASVEGETLPSRTYISPGEHTYEQPCSCALNGNSRLSVRFELDKCWGPTNSDQRQLGLQVAFWSYARAVPQPLSPIAIV